MSEIKFIAENNGFYRIDILGYENKNAQIEDDLNWLFCTFNLSLLNITMKYEINMQTFELNELKNSLSDFVNDKCDEISFTPMENNFHIKYTNNKGEIKCYLDVYDNNLHSKFSFNYKTNRTDLVRNLNEVSSILRIFPIIKK